MKRHPVEKKTNKSFNTYLQQHLDFEINLLRKGKKHAFEPTTLSLIAIIAGILTRMQNGIREHIKSVVYLT